MLTVNGPFDYNPDRWSGRMSSCHLRVYQLANKVAVVVATELASNMGPSITNSAEALATAVVSEYDLDPEKTHFIEHYDHDSGDVDSHAEPKKNQTYDLVIFRWEAGRACCASWKPTSPDIIEHLIGEKLS